MNFSSVFLALMYCLTGHICFAQEHINISVSLPDTAFINAYIRTTDQISMSNPDSAFLRYQHAAAISKSIGFNDAVLYCLLKTGSYYFNIKQDFVKSRAILYQALTYGKTIKRNSNWLIPTVYNLLGGTYFKTGNNDSAILNYMLALHVMDSLSLNTPRLFITINTNLGGVLLISRQYRQSADHIRKAITDLQKRSHTTEFNNDDKALLAINYANLGALHANSTSNMDSALYWWSKAILIYRALDRIAELQDVYANIARGWMIDAHEDLEKAKCYLDTAISMNPNEAEHNIDIQLGLGSIYYGQGQYARAIKHSKRALALCDTAGIRERKTIAYTTLSYCYAYLNDPVESRKYERLNNMLSDSLLNEKITRSVSQMEVQYRLSEKDKKLAQNKALLYKQRYWLTGSISLGLILSLFLLGLVRNNKQKRRLHAEQIQRWEQQKKLEHLSVKMEAEEQERTRIARELHDGLGVLLSAAKINYTLLGKIVPAPILESAAYQESNHILQQMRQEVRTIANNLVPDYITHKSLEAALEILAEKLNQPGAFSIRIYSYGAAWDLHPDRGLALYRVMEEIMHNALKHSQGTELIIQLMYHEQQLHITAEDNGIGFDTTKTYSGMGLQNIQGRVDMLKGHLNLSSDTGQGTTYTLEIPYRIS